MRSPLAIKTRAWLYIWLYVGATLLVSLSILAGGYYWFSLRGMRNELQDVAKEMVTNRLLVEDGEIKFRLDEEKRTLSGYLRDENMSAEIWDSSNKIIAKYGVFQNESEIINYHPENRETKYDDFWAASGERYLTLSVPVLSQGKKMGQLVLAIPMLMLGRFAEMGLVLISVVLVLSLLLSWPLSQQLVGVVFRSLDEVVAAMEGAGIENLKNKIYYNGSDSDEIGILVKTYNRLLDRLAEGLEKQKSFISNASHELKTPLARIVSTLEVMKLDLKEAEQQEKIVFLRDELLQLSKKVDGLLLLSRYDRDEQKVEKENIFLAKMVNKILHDYRDKISLMELKAKVVIDESLKVHGDKTGLDLVLTNLVSNAIKYNRQGGLLEILTSQDDREIRIEVVDQGEGIDKKNIGKIFERFFRGEKHQTKIAGFGVGMSLVKQICDRNGWRVEYDRNYSSGTRVVLSIGV